MREIPHLAGAHAGYRVQQTQDFIDDALWTVGRRPKLTIAVAALLSQLLADPSNAATATGTLKVQITLTSSCVIDSASRLHFGHHGVLTANVDSTSTLRVQCT